MTEAEWLDCTDIDSMLKFVRDQVSERKLRLFACACCRRIWPLLTDERSRRAVEIAERYADGAIDGIELSTARDAAWSVSPGSRRAAADAAAEATWGHDEFGGFYHVALLAYNVFFAVGEPTSERIAQ